MRPNLSPFEYGAYGTPFNVVSFDVDGPQESSDGRAAIISARDVSAMVSAECVELGVWLIEESRVLKSEIFRDGICGSGGAMHFRPCGLTKPLHRYGPSVSRT